MSNRDVRGNPCSSVHARAREAAEKALWRMMSFYDTPLADLDAASAADPGWALPHIMRAGFLLSLTEPSLLDEAACYLQQARSLMPHATPREKAHLEAVQATLDGRWHSACRIWDELLVEHPRDALALQWAQLWDFYRGDAAGLRQRPARALPEWDHHDPLYPHVLSLLAFGLEECNLYPQAEEMGRRALAANPRAPWAVHAVAHVMEMQGRFEEGAAWVRQHQPAWAEGNGFAGHLWWHKALFRLEALDVDGVMRLLDAHFSADQLQVTLQRVDAAALLWRLHLMGHDVSALCSALVQGWGLDNTTPALTPHTLPPASASVSTLALVRRARLALPGQAVVPTTQPSARQPQHQPQHQPGHYAFNDVHAVLALLGAGDVARAETWVARCAEQALKPSDAARANHPMAREIGLPLMRGLCALVRGDADGATQLIAPVLAQSTRLGGSHAQRDLINQTLLAAAAQGRKRDLGRALLNERRVAKPETPLTRYWMEALAEPTQNRA